MQIPDAWVESATLALWHFDNPEGSDRQPFPGPHRDRARVALEAVSVALEHLLTDAAVRQRQVDGDELARVADALQAQGQGGEGFSRAAEVVRGVPAVAVQ